MNTNADCAHCAHSRTEWTGASVDLLCGLGFRIRKPPHDCGSYRREPGADDDRGNISNIKRGPNRGPW